MHISMLNGRLRKPDLIFVKSCADLVVDIAVRYKVAFDTLEVAKSEKIAHYLPVAPSIINKLPGVDRATFFCFPVGARGQVAYS